MQILLQPPRPALPAQPRQILQVKQFLSKKAAREGEDTEEWGRDHGANGQPRYVIPTRPRGSGSAHSTLPRRLLEPTTKQPWDLEVTEPSLISQKMSEWYHLSKTTQQSRLRYPFLILLQPIFLQRHHHSHCINSTFSLSLKLTRAPLTLWETTCSTLSYFRALGTFSMDNNPQICWSRCSITHSWLLCHYHRLL